MTSPATFTMGFSGLGADSVWFTPMIDDTSATIGADLFAKAKAARDMAHGLLSSGCAMAAAKHPELAKPLSALARSELSLDFFDYPDALTGLGWFRLQAKPSAGATAEALAACERALAHSRAPLLCAKADGALLAFATGASDELPAPFRGAAHQASSKIASAFSQSGSGARLASAELIVLSSVDGAARVAICAPSATAASDPLADLKTFAKLAQSSIEARQLAADAPGSQAFFDAMDHALGAHPDSPPLKRKSVGFEPGAFFPIPEAIRLERIEGLPSEHFEALSKHFMMALAKRFGSIAASTRALPFFDTNCSVLSVPEQATQSALFSKLPQAPVSPSTPPTAPSPHKLA
jgi:hypothetical protein